MLHDLNNRHLFRCFKAVTYEPHQQTQDTESGDEVHLYLPQLLSCRPLVHLSMHQDVVRRWFKARRGTIGRFSFWGTVVPKGFIYESAYTLHPMLYTDKSHYHVLIEEDILI